MKIKRVQTVFASALATLFFAVIIAAGTPISAAAATTRFDVDEASARIDQFVKNSNASATLSFDVHILFGREDEIQLRLERAQFWLLTGDALGILEEAKLDLLADDFDGGSDSVVASDKEIDVYLEAAARTLLLSVSDDDPLLGNFFTFESQNAGLRANAAFSVDEETILAGHLLRESFNKHRIRVFNFDRFNSSARFTYRTGNYFIFGYGKLKGELIVWAQPVKLHPGENTFEFDQYNAAVLSRW